MPTDPLPRQRERDAVELLDRIYGFKADYQLSDDGMALAWIEGEIAAFVRTYGSFPDQLKEMDRGD